jgi:hypothetical protein
MREITSIALVFDIMLRLCIWEIRHQCPNQILGTIEKCTVVSSSLSVRSKAISVRSIDVEALFGARFAGRGMSRSIWIALQVVRFVCLSVLLLLQLLTILFKQPKLIEKLLFEISSFGTIMHSIKETKMDRTNNNNNDELLLRTSRSLIAGRGPMNHSISVRCPRSIDHIDKLRLMFVPCILQFYLRRKTKTSVLQPSDRTTRLFAPNASAQNLDQTTQTIVSARERNQMFRITPIA